MYFTDAIALRRPQWLLGLFCCGLISGCMTVNAVKPDTQSLDADAAVVAFSVRTSALTKFDELLTPTRILFSGTETRSPIGSKLADDDSGIAYVVYQLAEPGIVFDELILGDTPGFKTTMPGPEIPLQPSTISYLGRLQVEDFRFELKDDGKTYNPTHVKLSFSDRADDDIPVLKDRYAIFRNGTVKVDVLRNWNNAEFVPLARLVRGQDRVYDPNLLPKGPDPQDIQRMPPPPPGRN